MKTVQLLVNELRSCLNLWNLASAFSTNGAMKVCIVNSFSDEAR